MKKRLVDYDYQRDHLVDELQELGPEYVNLLARRDSIGDDSVVWWIDGSDRPIPFASLSPEEQNRLKGRLLQMRARVSALADEKVKHGSEHARSLAQALRNALIIPDDSSIWSLRGDPVLIEWGYEVDPDLTGGTRIVRELARRPNEKAAIVPAGAVSAPQVASSLFAALFGWIPFIVLVALIYASLLEPCALSLPLYRLDFCNAGEDSNLIAAQARGAELETQMQDAQVKLAQLLDDCRKVAEPVIASEKIEETVKKEGGRTGLFQVSLAWNTDDDLDLHVVCGTSDSEHVFYRQSVGCGGELDLDKTAGGSPANTLVENVFWERPPPPGEYLISVKLYRKRSSGVIPFSVRLKVGDQTKVLDHTLEVEGSSITVATCNFNRSFSISDCRF